MYESGYEKAEKLIEGVVKDLSNLVTLRDGEDLTCYYHCSLDEPISDLIKAKAFMASDRVGL